jgi:tetratricopeptide (TPR) repeat protein
MKLKKLLLVAFYILSLGVFAQTGTESCGDALSLFDGYVKQKKYDKATPYWNNLIENCPKIHASIYTNGIKMLKTKLKTAPEAEKGAIKNRIIEMFDLRAKYFPTYKGKNYLGRIYQDKGLQLRYLKVGTPQEIYNAFDKALTEDAVNVKNPKALGFMFDAVIALNKSGAMPIEKVFSEYDRISEKAGVEAKRLLEIRNSLYEKHEAETLTKKEAKQWRIADKNIPALESITAGMDAKLGSMADCSNLIPLYQRNYDKKHNDMAWLKRAANRLQKKECTSDPMFKKMVLEIVSREPSADGFKYQGALLEKNSDITGAIEMYKKAADMEEDTYKKANLFYKIARMYKKKGSYGTARSFANKAIAQKPSFGAAYMLIAGMYAKSANSCGNTTFDKKAVFWLSARVARKAASVDPSIKKSALRAAASWSAMAPSKEEIFTSGKAGQTVRFSCWVGQSVKVPNL